MNNRSYIYSHRTHPHYISNAQVSSLKQSLTLRESTFTLIIKQLSDLTKLKIFLLLHKVPDVAVTDITIILGITQSAASHALADLKKIGIVQSHRCGQLICYSLTTTIKNNRMFQFLEQLFET